MIFVANSGVSFQMMGLCHYYAWSIMHVALAALFGAVGGLGQIFARDTPGRRLLHGADAIIMVPLHR